jgi:hypothetical protein
VLRCAVSACPACLPACRLDGSCHPPNVLCGCRWWSRVACFAYKSCSHTHINVPARTGIPHAFTTRITPSPYVSASIWAGRLLPLDSLNQHIHSSQGRWVFACSRWDAHRSLIAYLVSSLFFPVPHLPAGSIPSSAAHTTCTHLHSPYHDLSSSCRSCLRHAVFMHVIADFRAFAASGRLQSQSLTRNSRSIGLWLLTFGSLWLSMRWLSGDICSFLVLLRTICTSDLGTVASF